MPPQNGQAACVSLNLFKVSKTAGNSNGTELTALGARVLGVDRWFRQGRTGWTRLVPRDMVEVTKAQKREMSL